jgi:threonine synthase
MRGRWHRPGLERLATFGHFAYLDLLPCSEAGASRFSLTVGGSPLLEVPRVAAGLGMGRVWLKDDTRLPSASFKDRASSVLLAMAADNRVARVSTASTGNAGCSMACLCANAGLEAVVFVPRTAPRAKVAQLLFYGATVIQVEGNYDAAFDLCWSVSQKHGWLNRSTGWNPFTREGKKTVSFEIAHQLGWQVPDLVFVPVGDGNIISGVWKGFRELLAVRAVERTPRIMAVQSTLSDAVARGLARAAAGAPLRAAIEPVQATTRADSISVDLPRDGVAAMRSVLESGGEAVRVTDDEIRAAIVELAGGVGLFAEPAGAAAFAGLKRWAATHQGQGLTAVCLVTGNGLKDVDAAMGLLAGPIVVPPDPGAAEAALGEKIKL